MRRWTLGLVWMLLIGISARSDAQDAGLEAEIQQAFQAISQAYAVQDTDSIRSMTAEDFVWITSFNGGGRTLDDQIAAMASGLTFALRPLGTMTVVSLAPDLALQRFHAEQSGSNGGEPLPSPVAATLIWQRQDGTWRQRLYQGTPIEN